MKKLIIFAALVVLASVAQANNYCNHGCNETPPAGENNPVFNNGQGQSADNHNTNGQGQSSDNRNNLGQGQSADNHNNVGQGQSSENNLGQGQSLDNRNNIGQGQSSDNTNRQGQTSSNSQGQSSSNSQGQSARGGNQTQGAASSVTVTDSSQRNVDARTLYVPPVIPVQAATVANAQLIEYAGTCGPMISVKKTPIVGKFFGLLSDSDAQLGDDYEVEPYKDEQGNVVAFTEANGRVMGHKLVLLSTTLNVAGSRGFSLGGGGSNGGWGQGGASGSSAMQRLVTKAIVVPCVYK